MKPYFFAVLSLIFMGCKSVVGPGEADAPPSLEQKYRDYILGSSNAWNAESIELYWKPMLEQFEGAVARSRKLDLSLGRDTLYRGSMAPKEEQALLKSIFNSYLLSLSLAYHVEGPAELPNPFFQSLEVKQLILDQLDYLHSRGFVKGHFIGPVKNEPCPQDVGDFFKFELRLSGYCTTMALMKDELKEAGVFEKYLETLRYICRPEKVHRHYHAEHRGYYNSDAARNVVDRLIPFALATDDPSEKEQVLHYVRDAMDASCSVTPGWLDTIKPDGSGFHHRGIYGAAYTTGFINETAFGLYLLANTPHQPDLQLYKDFELLMDAFVFYAEQLPFGLRGRMPLKGSGIPGSLHGYLLAAATPGEFYENAKARYARLAEDYSLSLDGGRGKVLRGAGFLALAGALENDVAEAAPRGIRVFPYGALMVQRTPDWMASVKGFSKTAWDYEASPTENMHGQYLSYGVLNIFDADEESGHDFESGWDWTRMPGATAVHYPVAEVDGRPDARRFNSKTFVGGVQLDETLGVFAMDFEDAPFPDQPHSPLAAKKSWFFFGDRIIALGSGITRSDGAHDVETTLFQTKLKNEALIPKGSWLADSVGNGYYVPEGQNLMVTSGSQKSRSHDDKTETAGEYLTAVINHGVSPQGASYEYVVCPGTENKVNVADSYKVIQQNDAAHIVEDLMSGTVAATLFSEFKASGGVLASVDRPALVLLQEKEAGRLALSVANPDLGLAEPDEEITFDLLIKDEEVVRRESKSLPVRVTLAGDWNLAEASDAAAIVGKSGGETTLEFQCRHGMGAQVELVQNKDEQMINSKAEKTGGLVVAGLMLAGSLQAESVTKSIDFTDSFTPGISTEKTYGTEGPTSTVRLTYEKGGNSVAFDLNLSVSRAGVPSEGTFYYRHNNRLGYTSTGGMLDRASFDNRNEAETVIFSVTNIVTSANVDPASVQFRIDSIGIKFDVAVNDGDILAGSTVTPAKSIGAQEASGRGGAVIKLDTKSGPLEGYRATVAITEDKGTLQYNLLDGKKFGLKTTLQFELN